ncbi:hypothetical protein FRAHR75_350076 [Frankia sp. Hr75.2]|nr:hypothetical protein FRAHR75_350076 [Frankia sp. Hr75.2]
MINGAGGAWGHGRVGSCPGGVWLLSGFPHAIVLLLIVSRFRPGSVRVHTSGPGCTDDHVWVSSAFLTGYRFLSVLFSSGSPISGCSVWS